MITRFWHGTTRAADAETYRRYVEETGIKGLLLTPGCLGAQIWQREEGNTSHIWTVSWWSDLNSIRGFAGETIEKARYYDDDKRFLLAFEPEVKHARCYEYPAGNEKLAALTLKFKEIYEGDPWYGDSFRKITGEISPERALSLEKSHHSIIQIVWHMIFWRRPLLERLKGNLDFKATVNDPENWSKNRIFKPEDWPATLEAFDRQHAGLLVLLGAQKDEFLETEYRDGRSVERLVEGVIQHDLYHLGQIALLGSKG